MVRAKFWCSGIDKIEWATIVTLTAVYSGSLENEQFFEATPVGKVEMYIKNEIAAQEFELNKHYYLDFTPVDDNGSKAVTRPIPIDKLNSKRNKKQ